MTSRSGQSLIEACVVIIILCLVLFGCVQVSQIFMAKEVLDHAAVCGARARAVGFNDFMVQKTIRAAAIPLAGQMVQPSYVSNPYVIVQHPHSIDRAWNTALNFAGGSAQFTLEHDAIPLYLGAGDWGQAAGVLDYKLDSLNKYGWIIDESGTLTKIPNILRTVTLKNLVTELITEDDISVTVKIQHDFPLNFAFSRALFEGQDSLPFEGDATIENHYKLYLQ